VKCHGTAKKCHGTGNHFATINCCKKIFKIGNSSVSEVLEQHVTITASMHEAFATLPEGTLVSLLLSEYIEQLQVCSNIMSWPVYTRSDLLSGNIYTINGDSIGIMVSDADILANDAKVVTADITASNDITHVIDTVRFPQDDYVAEEPASATAEELTNAEAIPMTEASAEAFLPL
jgi:uncharacterized surface protein with fasciclin (FAS1) repeats